MDKKQITRTLAAAALAVMFAGTMTITSGCSQDKGMQDQSAVNACHDCKGKNACKGQGGCSTSDNGCNGKNSCKGQGGCKS